jgi:DNA-binding NtrC family response regulator
VGGNDELRVDVRLIAATNRDIIEAIGQHNFREDLFHRLNVVQFRPSPLRERGNDVMLLADSFLQHFNATMNKHVRGFAAATRQKLLSYHWPGNVRELRNAIERAVILENSQEIQPGSLPDFQLEGRLRKSDSIMITGNESLDELMSDFERQVINTALEQSRYNMSKTAEQLKISRHALRYRMQRLNISLGPDEEGPPPPARES